ncbi:MAG: DUF1570 domain-containing protein [Planctomycetota bacterium]
MEYLQRLRNTDANNPVALMDLADWAQRYSLTDQAAEHYRALLALEPDHPHAYDKLMAIADNGQLPRNDNRERELMRKFGEPFQLHVSPHFLVVYDTDKAWAVNRAVLLEKTHDLYYQSMRNADLRPLPLEERLVCVLFDDHAMFRRYGEVVDDLKMSWSSGYYSSRTNRIAFFNDKTSPAFAETTAQIVKLEASIEDLKSQIREPRVARNPSLLGEARRQLAEHQRELNWRRNRLHAQAGMNNASKTTHEALHQLAFNSELLRRGVSYPFWLVEGMATNYEVEDASKGFGPYYVNRARREQLIEHTKAQRLFDLPDFVSWIGPPPEGGESVAVMYAQSWGMFQFLFKKRHKQMREYLRRMRAPGRGELDELGLLNEFEDAFGDLKRLEREWQGYLRQLRS